MRTNSSTLGNLAPIFKGLSCEPVQLPARLWGPCPLPASLWVQRSSKRERCGCVKPIGYDNIGGNFMRPGWQQYGFRNTRARGGRACAADVLLLPILGRATRRYCESRRSLSMLAEHSLLCQTLCPFPTKERREFQPRVPPFRAAGVGRWAQTVSPAPPKISDQIQVLSSPGAHLACRRVSPRAIRNHKKGSLLEKHPKI